MNLLDGLLSGLPDFAEALCAQTDPELFFPERGEPSREAKQLCRSCHDQTACLDYALTTRQRFGIWGGTSEHERRQLAKDRLDQITKPAGVAEPGARQYSDAGLASLRATAAHARAAKQQRHLDTLEQSA